MFQREDMLSFFKLVDELEASLDAGDVGQLKMGYDEDELIQMAKNILEGITEGLSKQKGFTHAQLVVSSHVIREQLMRERGLQLTHDQLMERAPMLLQAANNFLSEDEREKECVLSGFLDAQGYLQAATYYADADLEDEARRCIAGARYWKQRLLDNCRD